MPSWIVRLEHAWDARRLRRSADRTPHHFRIESYGGHGSAAGVVVRGRVFDDPPITDAVEGEGVRAALSRTVRRFLTDELPGVPLRVTVGDASAATSTDHDGYFKVRLEPDPASLVSPWTRGSVELDGDYRGLREPCTTPVEVRVPEPEAAYGVISDVDDTILVTGVQRVFQMVRQTLTGSSLSRRDFPGAAALYRDLAAQGRPVFYVSSSPWNLHGFLTAFMRHRRFPLGPVLLRDLLGTAAGREQKHTRIDEVLELHPDLHFVLLGDSGEKDAEIYAATVRDHPGRILAVCIREVRLDPGDGRVEAVSDGWDHDVPFVLAADTEAIRHHLADLGLL
ncbi:App1 family protein [Nocardioides aestuarii]|uniref:App1 family protein n=1 Tax=Nocardioides aestuarii TaxID=252231 RepID=A0ABW4TH42_9ACTN